MCGPRCARPAPRRGETIAGAGKKKSGSRKRGRLSKPPPGKYVCRDWLEADREADDAHGGLAFGAGIGGAVVLVLDIAVEDGPRSGNARPERIGHAADEGVGLVIVTAEVAIPRALFAEILRLINRLRPAPLPP